jgi:hypothetical protein
MLKSKESNMKFTDQNGQYNFEGFTSLEDFVAAELVKYPHTVGLITKLVSSLSKTRSSGTSMA